MIDRATVDKILDTVEIVDVISDFVSLKRKGANYMACCPFHNEKTPSFSVSPSKGIFKCFGCGKAGSAVTFIMEHEQMTYSEALKYLGKKYGIEVHEKEETEEDAADRLRHESLLLVSEFAQKYFQNILLNTGVGQAIGLSYFKDKRGFSDETIQKFGLGYSIDSHHSFQSSQERIPTLAEAAVKAGYKKEFLLGTGLCFEKGSGVLSDKFYDRVMFPIHSLSGRVIAFGGRTLRTDKEVSKYVNSPETEIYHKSNSLYGIFFAKSAIAKLQKCYLVEGYTDVISLHQAGVENVVASSGTSLTTDQIRLIKRFTTKVTVLYDGDSAGIKASIRGIDMLLEEGLEVKVVLFPDGDDPDSYARSHTRDQITDFLDSAETDFIAFKYDLLAKDIAKDPIRKAELIREIVRTISLIPDQIVRTVYIEECATRLDVKQEVLIQEVARTRREYIASGQYERKRAEEREQRRRELEKTLEPQQGNGSAGATSGTSTDASGSSTANPYENVPPPTEEDFYGGANSSQGASLLGHVHESPLVSVPALEPSEKELVYYLLKFGESIMTFDEHQIYGSEKPVMDITVAQYIAAELKNDDIEFQNAVYKEIFDLYFKFRSESQDQDKIQKMFVNHPNEAIVKTVLDLIYQEYTINVKEYVKSLIPEENVLGMVVPKAVLIYKAKITDYTFSIIMEQLGRAQSEGDTQTQEELMQQIKILTMVRNQFAKELNRL